MRYRMSSPCRGSNTFDAVPEGEVELSPEKMCSILQKSGFAIKMKSDILVIGIKGEIEVALYRRGKAIIKKAKEKADAEKIAESIFSQV
ncbi:MAG: hypothetical protein N3G76_00175 [Candidatus Micrarchaeota archaeon]|nr:hypothetical protein [Candidatus Micrarchaeota archaeon]